MNIIYAQNNHDQAYRSWYVKSTFSISTNNWTLRYPTGI